MNDEKLPEKKISERRRHFIEMKAKREADRQERWRKYYEMRDKRSFWVNLWHDFWDDELPP